MDMNLSQFWETVKDKEALRAAAHGAAESQTRLSDWTTTNINAGQSRNCGRHNFSMFC